MRCHFLAATIAVAFAIGCWPVTRARAQVYDWTGVYLGGQIGGQWLNSKSSFNFSGNPGAPASGSKTFHDSSFTGGGQVGFNWQPAAVPVVFGIEADLTGANHVDGGIVFRYPSIPIDHFDGRSQLDVQGSIRGRMGWALNRVLLYGTSGMGFGAGKVTTIFARDGIASARFGKSDTLVGWTVGGGIEYALPFSSHWLIRGEYRYSDLGSIGVSTPGITFPANVGPWTAKGRFRTQGATVAVSFKF